MKSVGANTPWGRAFDLGVVFFLPLPGDPQPFGERTTRGLGCDLDERLMEDIYHAIQGFHTALDPQWRKW